MKRAALLLIIAPLLTAPCAIAQTHQSPQPMADGARMENAGSATRACPTLLAQPQEILMGGNPHGAFVFQAHVASLTALAEGGGSPAASAPGEVWADVTLTKIAPHATLQTLALSQDAQNQIQSVLYRRYRFNAGAEPTLIWKDDQVSIFARLEETGGASSSGGFKRYRIASRIEPN